MVLGVAVTSVGGAVGSFYLTPRPGALIVVLAIAVFALSWPISGCWPGDVGWRPCCPNRSTTTEPAAPHVVVTEGHPHQHAPGCGHVAVQHGDHTDFLHEGHRHAAHADHYDEH